jgi:hypothetical protein
MLEDEDDNDDDGGGGGDFATTSPSGVLADAEGDGGGGGYWIGGSRPSLYVDTDVDANADTDDVDLNASVSGWVTAGAKNPEKDAARKAATRAAAREAARAAEREAAREAARRHPLVLTPSTAQTRGLLAPVAEDSMDDQFDPLAQIAAIEAAEAQAAILVPDEKRLVRRRRGKATDHHTAPAPLRATRGGFQAPRQVGGGPSGGSLDSPEKQVVAGPGSGGRSGRSTGRSSGRSSGRSGGAGAGGGPGQGAAQSTRYPMMMDSED